ncbi:MAG: hypothetical protein C4328_11095 [Meiothermus sp.]
MEEVLLDRLRGLASRRAGVALALWGEPGIGKSHLARRVQGALPFPSYTLEARLPPSQCLKRLPPAPLPPWAQEVWRQVEGGGVVEVRTLVDLLATWLYARSPLLLVVEDLHQCAWREIWEALAGRVRQLPGVGLLATSRPRPGPPFEAFRVPPLGRAELARLLPGLPVEAVDWIHGKSRGNPLFALEYARLLRRQGHLWQGEGGWYWREPGPDPAHPTLLEAVLSVALQPVWASRGRGEVLLALGLAGGAADRETLARGLGYTLEGLQRQMDELEGLGLLAPDGQGGQPFHPLLVEVAVQEEPGLAREVARRLLSHLRNPPPAVLAAAKLSPEEVADWLSHTRPDPQALAPVASLLEDPQELLEVARALAHYPAQALPAARKAHRLAPASAEARELLVDLLLKERHLEEARRLLEGAGAAPRSLWARLLWEERRYEELVALWQGEEPGGANLRFLSAALQALGRMEEARSLCERRLARGADREAGFVWHALGNLHTHCARYAEAAWAYERALEALGADNPAGLGVRLNLVYVYECLGQTQQALLAARALVRLTAEWGLVREHCDARQKLALVLRALDRREEAEAELLSLREELLRLDDPVLLAYVEGNLAELLRERSSAAALWYARRALATARRAGDAFVLGYALNCAALCEATYGEAPRALYLAEEALDLAQRSGRRGSLAGALLARALARKREGQEEQAQADLAESERIFTEIGNTAALQEVRRWWEGAPPPSPAGEPAGNLRLEVLGPARLGGVPLPPKLEALLLRLLEARIQGHAGCGVLELLDALYPGLPEREARHSLQQLVYRARRRFGAGVIRQIPEGYALGEVTSDAEAFLLERDLRCWRGVYRGSDPVRARLVGLLCEGVEALLRPQTEGAPLGSGPPGLAEHLARILVEMEPYDGHAWSLLLRATPPSCRKAVYREVCQRFGEVDLAPPPLEDRR